MAGFSTLWVLGCAVASPLPCVHLGFWCVRACVGMGVRGHRLTSPIFCVPSLCPEDRAALWGYSGAELGGSLLERA